MPKLLILALFASWAASAQDDNPLYSAYCAALLEHQRPVDRELAVDFTRALHQVVVRAEALAALYPTTDDAVIPEEQPLLVTNYGKVKSSRTDRALNYDARSLRRIPNRVVDLHTHVNSIQDGVVAAGVMVRGEANILAYLERVRVATKRNDRDLLPVAQEVLPHATKTRTISALLAAATPLVPAGAIVAWVTPSLIHFQASAMQVFTATIAIAIGRFAVPAMLDMPYAYAKGFWSADGRDEFERTYGRRSVAPEYQGLERLGKMARRLRRRPNGLAYYTTQRTFSEAEMRDVNAAAAAAKAPSGEFLRRHEDLKFYRKIVDQLLPISYDLVTDQICYFDHEWNEPVLLTFTRFIRSLSYPPKKPRELRSGSKSGDFGAGGLSPAGA